MSVCVVVAPNGSTSFFEVLSTAGRSSGKKIFPIAMQISFLMVRSYLLTSEQLNCDTLILHDLLAVLAEVVMVTVAVSLAEDSDMSMYTCVREKA